MQPIRGKYTSSNYSESQKASSNEFSGDQVSIVTTNSFANLKKTLSHKAQYYEQLISELQNKLENEVLDPEERRKYRVQAIQNIALMVATDFSMLAQYKLDSPSSYMDKTIDPFIQYLRDIRATLNLIISVEST